MLKHLFLTAAVALITAPVSADMLVQFREGAPTDRFMFEWVGACALSDVTLTVDLSGSDAGLIFDVTGAGAGVEVFQPFTLVAGADLVSATSGVTDGAQTLSLSATTLLPGAQIAFTIDVDDTIGAREITVSGAEIQGARAQLEVDGVTSSAAFGADAVARIAQNACLS